MKKIVELAHDFLLEVLNESDTAIDFTCGQGYDTCFLAAHCQHVIGFDIQPQAITLTTQALAKQALTAKLYLDSHSHADQYVDQFQAGIFNLGYLPHGDQSITTQASEVLTALDRMLPRLNKGGRLILVLYPGFTQGLAESHEIEAYCEKLPARMYDSTKIQLTNRHHAPYLLLIDKH